MIDIPRILLELSDAQQPQPNYRFRSDGCSGLMSWLWWTFVRVGPPWESCCVVHDFAYWRGGTRADRRKADKRLRQCVAAKAQEYGFIGNYLVRGLAWIMWIAVRIGGVPWLPTGYRWGYGWRYPRGYQ